MKCIDCKYFKTKQGTQFCEYDKDWHKHKRIMHGDEIKDIPCTKVETIDEIVEKYYPQYKKYLKEIFKERKNMKQKEILEQSIHKSVDKCIDKIFESKYLLGFNINISVNDIMQEIPIIEYNVKEYMEDNINDMNDIQ